MKYLFIFMVILVGCTARQTTEERKSPPVTKQTGTVSESLPLVRALQRNDSESKSLRSSGTITLRSGKSSQSGSFDLKSKRFTAATRSDSLSMVVSGPFGITAAKFLGSEQEYIFYNALEGDVYRGKPDPRTIEKLTGIRGLGITSLNNVLYGLPPNPLTGDDYPAYRISSSGYLLLIHTPESPMTEALYLSYRAAGSGRNVAVRITEYRRWNKIVTVDDLPTTTADIYISYSGYLDPNKHTVPERITVIAGGTEFEIENRTAELNTNPVVKIKMPQ